MATTPAEAKVSFVPNGSPNEKKNLAALKLRGCRHSDGGRWERWSRPDLEAENKNIQIALRPLQLTDSVSCMKFYLRENQT